MPLRWYTQTWSELSKENLYKILSLRAEVFVVEQDCPYLDTDDKDKKATHILAYDDETLIGYARIFLHNNPCVIGRVVVKATHRGKSIGKMLMKKSICEVPEENPIFISAQEHLKRFYESLGFIQTEKGYLEDGIPHIPMILPPRSANNLKART